MLICDYKHKNDLTLAEAQFIIAIAIDYEGYKTVAEKVLQTFQANNEEERAFEFERAEALSNKIKASGDGMITGLIKALYHDKILRKTTGGRYNRDAYVNLAELGADNITNLSEALLYSRTMQLVSAYPVNYFILLYMQTDMWFDYFKGIATSKGSKLDDDIVRQLNDAFKTNAVSRYSSNGQYNPETRTPHVFLNSTFNWFKNNEIYYEIINSKSILSGISEEDNRSLLDLHVDGNDVSIDKTITNYKYTEGINFIEIAKKIYEASISMFQHAQERKAYYDIVSWYKSYLAAQIRRNNQKLLISMKNLYQIDFIDSAVNEENEKKKKKSVRCAVCEKYYLPLLDHDLSIEDIYPFFSKVREGQYAEAGYSAKDGKLMFSYGAYSRKDSNDSSNFQKHYEGFLALKELLAYLDSAQNELNLTIFDIPVDIFRDSRYLKRFKSFHEYVFLYKDVKELLQECDSDSARLQSISPIGIYSNDSIYAQLDDILNKSSVDSLLDKLKNVSMVPTNSRNSESETERIDRLLLNPLKVYSKKVVNESIRILPEQDINKLMETENLRDPATCINYITVKSLSLLLDMINNKKSEAVRINAALAVINMVEFLFTILGNSIENNGIYNLQGTLREELERAGVPNSTFTRTVNNKLGTFNYLETLCKAVEVAMRVLNVPRDNLKNAFNIARIMNGIFIKLEHCYLGMCKEINEAKKQTNPNFYLCYAKIMYENEVINLSYPIKEFSKLIQFAGRNYIAETIDISDDNIQMHDIINKKRENANEILNVINSNLTMYADLFKIMQEFKSLAINTLRVTGNAVGGISAKRYKMLFMLNAKICTEKLRTSSCKQLEDIGKLSTFQIRNNYLMHNNEYVMLGEYHVHVYGYKVSTGIADDLYDYGLNQNVEPEILELTDLDLGKIHMTWNLGDNWGE